MQILRHCWLVWVFGIMLEIGCAATLQSFVCHLPHVRHYVHRSSVSNFRCQNERTEFCCTAERSELANCSKCCVRLIFWRCSIRNKSPN